MHLATNQKKKIQAGQEFLPVETLQHHESLKNDVSTKHLIEWVTNYNGLLWELEVQRSCLHVLNTWQHPLLGNDTERLLKDVQYRREMIHTQDNLLLAEFWDVVAAGEQASVIFRVLHPQKNTMIHFILKGWIANQDPTHIFGTLQELPEAMALHENDSHPHWVLSHTNYPVLEVDIEAQTVFVNNASAHTLFGLQQNLESPHTGTSGISLQTLILNPKNTDICFSMSHESSDFWLGTKIFQTVQGDLFHALVRIAPLQRIGQYRIAFIRTFSSEQEKFESFNAKVLLEVVNKAKNLKQALKVLLDSPILPEKVDGLIFSDIQTNKEIVTVYGVGKVFDKLKWGSKYTYKGTIAQDIERFMLSHLVVDDTHNSIKSIDWVLFNPYGIRSYFAKPFYLRKTLHAVLILCSSTPRAFTPENGPNIDALCSQLYSPFEFAIKKWRQEEQS